MLSSSPPGPERPGSDRRSWRFRAVVGALALLSLALPVAPATAQAAPPSTPPGAPGLADAGRAGPAPRGITVWAPPRPEPFFIPNSEVAPNGARFLESVGAPFSVTYDAGFNANAAAKAAFQAAVDIWATKIKSSVTIRVSAEFQDLGFNPNSYTLGQAGPSETRADFPGAPVANTFYALALANALAGTQLSEMAFDILATFNSNAGVPWYFGLSGPVPQDKNDFLSTVLHELGHGLGFLGSMNVGNAAPPDGCGMPGAGCYTNPPVIFDRFTETKSAGTALLSFTSPSASLGTQLTTPHSVVFDGPNTRASGGPAQLFTPGTWQPGSSYSHVDDIYAGTPNSLMTAAQAQGTAERDPGPLMLGIFQDTGWRLNTATHAPADFDGNNSSDLSVFRPAGAVWFERTAAPAAIPWGATGDIPVPGDYDGDGNIDEAVFRPSNGVWYLRSTPAASIPWGATDGGDIPVPADYDGDGKTDLAVFRASNNTWYVRTATPAAIPWGATGDIPVPADYDGNGTADIGVFRPSNSNWYLRTAIPVSVPWGAASDIPVPGDYDGDGRADIAVFRPGTATWYLRTAAPAAVVWGGGTDVPVPGDYNADGKVDIAVFRPSTNIWYLKTPTPSSPAWGASGDIPLPLPFAIRRVFFP